ncbi:dTDP-glucose 4,6-dehydratase [Gammaproteobacteria bacterium SCGC AG-212-F23]|nr:dTDP-glucose 4,6-dehydratase [Gammaproteobacteria bacterium SCGC AG-212-F23]
MILVTGGCGFIGANFVLDWINIVKEPVIVLDKLTYAGNINNLDSLRHSPELIFIKGDINDPPLVESILTQHRPRAMLNFAAESHVDRSIRKPDDFIHTNINGTFCLLENARQYWQHLSGNEKEAFRFLQVSTDEVYGSLTAQDPAFSETTPYHPKNPYSASKAAADHLVSAFHHTYGMPTLITNCSNNYGPYQFPEKLIPLLILNALQNKPLFIYGDGLQIRDWLYVKDHCEGIRKVLADSPIGETFNIGGNFEKTNLEVVHTVCNILDQLKPAKHSYKTLITHIEDRPGHDRRYAIDSKKIQTKLNWQPTETFESGIRKTIQWYLDNLAWFDTLKNNNHYQNWINSHYKESAT